MSKIKFVFLIAIFLFSIENTNAQIVNNALQDSIFVIDGYDNDWNGVMHYNSSAKMIYGLSNDDKNLYVKIKIDDEVLQKKILLTGLTFWMDTVGKSKKQLSVTCPVKRDPQIMNKEMNNRQKDGQKKNADSYRELVNSKFLIGLVDMEVEGFFKYPDKVVLNNKNDNGINVVLHINNSNEMIWEALIPLKMIFANPTEFLNEQQNYFSFGFETGSVDFESMNPQGSSQAQGQMGGRGGGGGGKGRNGMGNGQNPNANPERMQMMQAMRVPSKFKVKKASFVRK